MQIERDMVLANRYRVEDCLGRGGMGTVWRGRDLRLGRPVAIKLAAPAHDASDASSGAVRRRLRREAEALAALSEPRIARVFDLVEADQEVCLVMELIDGESLAERLNRQPRLSAREALEITAQCAQALEAAHRIGIVHRDVKPSNIMLGPDGVKMVDFGIAAHIGPASGDTTQTLTGELVGTAAYLAPERALGKPAGAAADFYSLGVVLYQMLAGRLPFRAGESLAILYAHATAKPEPLPTDVPAPARALCMRLLDKNPAKRPTTAAQIIAARDASKYAPSVALLEARADSAADEPTHRGVLLSRGRAKHRRAGSLAALGSTAVVLAASITWVLSNQSADAGAVTSAPPSKSSSHSTSAVVQLPPTTRAAVVTNVVPAANRPSPSAGSSNHKTTAPPGQAKQPAPKTQAPAPKNSAPGPAQGPGHTGHGKQKGPHGGGG